MSSNISEAAKQPEPRFVPMPTHGCEIKEWAFTMHYAISEILLLAFEHRDLDLEEQQTYALNLCVRVLADLAYIISDPEGLEDGTFGQAIKAMRERFPAKGAEAPMA
jgi:hypothetical protein